MKTITVVLSTFLLGVSLMAAETPLIQVDKSRIEAIAAKAIIANHSDLKPTDFVLSSVSYSSASSVESGTISVTFLLPATAKTDVTTEGTIKAKHTHYDGFSVLLTNYGMILKVTKADINEDDAL